jgi:hypothetical protein
MPLCFNLSDDRHEIITNSDPIFAGTPFSKSDFTVEVKPIARDEYAKIQRKHTFREQGALLQDEHAMETEIFCKVVSGWQGIVDEKGTPIPYNDQTKFAIANKHWKFASLINLAMVRIQSEQKEKQEETRKN